MELPASTDSLSLNTVEEAHSILTLYFTILVDQPKREPHFYESVRDGERKKIYENLPPTRYFHINYQPFPTHQQKTRTTKVYSTDVVCFKDVVAKVYTDVDTRVIPGRAPENENSNGGDDATTVLDEQAGASGELVAFRWKHKHKFVITKPHLLQLHQYVMEVCLSPLKRKVCVRANYDRPKAFRLPFPPSSVTLGKKSSFMFPMVSQETRLRNSKGRKTHVSGELSGESARSSDTQNTQANLDVTEDKDQTKDISYPVPPTSSPALRSRSSKNIGSKQLSLLGKKEIETYNAEVSRKPSAVDEADKWVILKLRLSDLFSSEGIVKAKLETPVEGLRGFEVEATGGKPFLSDQLSRELKPMTITVQKVSKLPTTPLSHQELSERCEPVYVSYRFPSRPLFSTPSLPHYPHLTFNSTNVILLGVIEQNILLEYLRGPPLVFEVHDRDCKEKNTKFTDDSRFGQDVRDSILGTHAFSTVIGKTLKKPPSPYGIARCDLSDFANGIRFLSITIPVTRGPRISAESSSSSLGRSQILPHGDYLESGCEITIKIELQHQLALATSKRIPSPAAMAKAKSPSHIPQWRNLRRKNLAIPTPTHHVTTCPFTRLVYVISSEGKPLLQRLLRMIDKINASTLGLDSLPPNVLEAALSTYKLTNEQLSSFQHDLITGFHVDDWERHIVMLEGLKEKGISTLWNELPHHHSQDQNIIKVFYNSDYNFSKRLYGTLDVDLPRIRLFRPLREIMQHPLIFIPNCIPPPSFRALLCLNELPLVNEIADMTRNNLFPTAEEVAALSIQFALPSAVTPEPPTSPDHAHGKGHSSPARPKRPDVVSGKTLWLTADTSNPEFDEAIRRRRMLGYRKNFIQSNIAHVEALSMLSRSRKKPAHFRSQSEDSALPVHNYSSCTYNSTREVLDTLRVVLDPSKRYTFNQDYHSMTLAPINIEAEERAKRIQHKRLWRTKDGFVYPGLNSSLQDNTHPKKPDSARIQDLTEPYEDNFLLKHAHRPLVDSCPGKKDFDLWKPPPNSLDDIPCPFSVHIGGDAFSDELKELHKKEVDEWKEKIVVNDILFHTHRRGFTTELGEKAATKLDCLQGLLKDPPEKLTLKKPGLKLEEILPYDIVRHPNADPAVSILSLWKQKKRGGYIPGPHSNHSLRTPGNVIPLEDRRANMKSTLHTEPFRQFYHTHNPLYIRPIEPLSQEINTTSQPMSSTEPAPVPPAPPPPPPPLPPSILQASQTVQQTLEQTLA